MCTVYVTEDMQLGSQSGDSLQELWTSGMVCVRRMAVKDTVGWSMVTKMSTFLGIFA